MEGVSCEVICAFQHHLTSLVNVWADYEQEFRIKMPPFKSYGVARGGQTREREVENISHSTGTVEQGKVTSNTYSIIIFTTTVIFYHYRRIYHHHLTIISTLLNVTQLLCFHLGDRL